MRPYSLVETALTRLSLKMEWLMVRIVYLIIQLLLFYIQGFFYFKQIMGWFFKR